MKTVGITNNAGKDRYLYFQEADAIALFDIIEEANFISQVSGIDIDILESSLHSYHLVSFDILTLREMQYIEHLNSITGHYPDIDELGLSRMHTAYKRLRLGPKGNKKSPRWYMRILARERNKYVKSYAHLWIYNVWCDVPYFPFSMCRETIRPDEVVCVYAYGPARKNLRAKQFRKRMMELEEREDRGKYFRFQD